SLQVILDLVMELPDTEVEQRTLHIMAAKAVRAVWHDASRVLDIPLASASASLQLDFRMKEKFGERLMTDDLSSKLGTRVNSVLYEMDAHLTPANRASIRSAAR